MARIVFIVGPSEGGKGLSIQVGVFAYATFREVADSIIINVWHRGFRRTL